MSVLLTQNETPSHQASRWADFRLIPRVERWPAAVAFVQTAPGKAVLLTAFAVGMRFFLPDWDSAVGLAFLFGIITFLPEYRRPVLAVAPVLLVVRDNFHNPVRLAIILLVIVLGMTLYLCVMRWPKSLFARRPIVFLLSGFSLLIVLACSAPAHAGLSVVLWEFVAVFATYVWFIAYALTDKSSVPNRDAPLELAAFRPLWGSTNTPLPKGAAYLRKIEAKTPEQLAVVQLKGLKLLAWAILLALFQNLWFGFFHGSLHIPLPDQALAMSVRGTPVAWHLRWAAQILAYFELILSFSILGHRIIACARMAGFNALRNTCRPLSSTTLIDFFNRFYYYFKELLVDFFYFPAFLRYFKKHRRLRTVFATCAAVVFGDSFYHLTRDWTFLRNDGLWKGIASYQVLLVYNTALAIGLSISQLRRRKPRARGFLRGQLLPSAGVAFFYILVIVFGSEARPFTLNQTLHYFAGLFFVHY
ncbi:MAG TPA: hypothetical protein VHX37_02600 [Acidobacteriaceae bacterium]|jgi:hypothetical protein|nr:hypothetical protein [Acidobacteriaceae bacterium]